MQPAADFQRILRALTASEVRFIVVGGVSAVLHGAPITTFDLDIVPDREPSNIYKLLTTLEELEASYRGQFGRIIRPTASALEGKGHHLLITNAGPLDVLGTIGQSLGFAELLPFSRDFGLAENGIVRVLELAKHIEIKEQLGTPKDQAVLPILKRTLAESE